MGNFVLSPNIILYVPTAITTILILLIFGRLVFSIGEHVESTKTVPVVTFMITGCLFMDGFILFSLYSTFDPNLFWLDVEYYNFSYIFWSIFLFEVLICIDVIISNKILLFIDRYLFNKWDGMFVRYWHLVFPMLKRNNKVLISTKIIIQAILAIMLILTFFESNLFSFVIYPTLYLMYLVMFVLTLKYFRSIGNLDKR